MKRFDVTVAGELNLDIILEGLPEQLAPEREILASGMTVTLGSSSAILAHNLRALGSRVGFISRIGSDPLGQISLDRLATGGVDVSLVKRSPDPALTGLTVILSHADARNILTYPGVMFDLCFDDLSLEYLTDARHFHLSSFFLHRALLPQMPRLFESMKAVGLTTSLDLNDDPDNRWNSGVWEVLKFVDILFVNERELKQLTGATDVEAGARKLAGTVSYVAVKLGGQGGALFHRGETLRSPAHAVRIADVVGAGDSFDAGFLHQFVRGADMKACLDYANLAGAFSTTQPGGTGAFLDAGRVTEFFSRRWPAASSGVIP